MLNKIKQHYQELMEQNNNPKSTDHFERTVYWLKQLKPDADEAMQIAAYAHDIQRVSLTKEDLANIFENKEIDDPEVLKIHQKEGAKMVVDFLKKENYGPEAIKRIYNMVRHHEEGGDEESNLIKDADSISYMEINAPKHIKHYVKFFGEEGIKRKINWMYSRITLEKARELAKPYYEKALELYNSK